MMERPDVIVNVAASVDGKIDTYTRASSSISSAWDKDRVDQLRAEVDAVLVGGHTLIVEDPGLSIRSLELQAEREKRGLSAQPAGVGIVSSIPANVQLNNFLTRGNKQTFIFTTYRTPGETISRLRSKGTIVHVSAQHRVDLAVALDLLHQAGIQKVLVEGGGTLIAELFRMEMVDELFVYIAPRIFAGATSPTLADGKGFLLEDAPRLLLHSASRCDEYDGILLHYHCSKYI